MGDETTLWQAETPSRHVDCKGIERSSTDNGLECTVSY
jgi:hypothetical protein